MGYEPTTNCRHCGEPLDVYQPVEDRFCDEDCKAAATCENCPAPAECRVLMRCTGIGGFAPRLQRKGSELGDVLIAVAQLIDGWRADSAWTAHDEEVRYRVHAQLSRINGVVPMAREQFCHGHVASDADPKICGRCGVHVQTLT